MGRRNAVKENNPQPPQPALPFALSGDQQAPAVFPMPLDMARPTPRHVVLARWVHGDGPTVTFPIRL